MARHSGPPCNGSTGEVEHRELKVRFKANLAIKHDFDRNERKHEEVVNHCPITKVC